jgi:hypothetical protein
MSKEQARKTLNVDGTTIVLKHTEATEKLVVKKTASA